MTYDNLNNNFKKAQLKKAQLKKAFSLIELSVVVLIIGILIAGITAGSRLVRNSKLASAAQFTKSSDINSIPDLVLWLEPTQENSFATTSSNTDTLTYANVAGLQDSAYVKDTLRPDNREYVARWNDITPRAVAGNKKSVYQETGSRRPMYIANAINGLPALQFDGSSQYLYSLNNNITPSAPPLVAGDRTMTMVAVFTTNSNATALDRTMIMDQFVGFSSSQASAREVGMAFNSNINTASPNRLYLLAWNGDPYSAPADNMPINVGVPNIAIITADDNVFDVSSNVRICLNGKCIAPSNPNPAPYNYSGTVWNPASDTFAIATRAYNGSKNILNGYIGEVMVFDRALKTEEIDIINKYLSKKWGIALK